MKNQKAGRFANAGSVKTYLHREALAVKGFPVAQTYFTCKAVSVLGGAFFKMDFLPGKPLASAALDTMPEMLEKPMLRCICNVARPMAAS